MNDQSFRKLFGILSFAAVLIALTSNVSGQNMFRKVNDFDGDGKADYAITRNENGYKYWYVWQSTAGFSVFQFGLDTDRETAGDYDGDGKIDYSVYRTETSSGSPSYLFHVFWFYESSTNVVGGRTLWTQRPAVMNPFPQDYNGDGKTDGAISIDGDTNHPQPYIFILDNSFTRIKYYSDGNIPVRIGDMTGDFKSEIVSYSPLNNVVTVTNYASSTSQSVHFGAPGDQYVPADFDGDGKGDLTIFRESDGTWWWMRSSDNVVQAVRWGSAGDTPVPADYDGDGKTDLAIWRGGNYWILGSQNGISVFNWGLPTDTPVTY